MLSLCPIFTTRSVNSTHLRGTDSVTANQKLCTSMSSSSAGISAQYVNLRFFAQWNHDLCWHAMNYICNLTGHMLTAAKWRNYYRQAKKPCTAWKFQSGTCGGAVCLLNISPKERPTHTHTHTPKTRAIAIPASPPGVLTHTILNSGSLMIAAGTHTGKNRMVLFSSANTWVPRLMTSPI